MEKEKIKKVPTVGQFGFIISDSGKKFIQQLVYNKIVEGQLEYSLTDAILDGVYILQKKNPNVPERKNVRRYNQRGPHKSPITGSKTSILMPFLTKDWIENYISHKIESDILYTRTIFINDLINLLKKKYKGKLLEVPEI
jgi:hypothetical protein